VRLWALASSQYPRQHDFILEAVSADVIESMSVFAINARRAMEVLPSNRKFRLLQPRWRWTPTDTGEVVSDLWDGLNRIIHARKVDVGFEDLPNELSIISGGAVVVPYVRARTDKKELAYIDPFAMTHAFLYGAFPLLAAAKNGIDE
jgi:hypothetical protein